MNDFFNPFESMSFTYDKCFLCGNELVDSESLEHVFPKWLQNRFNLWDEKLILNNGTDIPYRKLTIPCCSICNNEHLSKVERLLQRAFNEGYNSIANLEEIVLYQWISKIFYGIFFKELSLPLDRRDHGKGTIINSELLERLRILHCFLQSIRTPFRFEGFKPWSIFLIETISYGDRRDFGYYDGFLSLTFSIRLGNVGIIACLEDNGVIKEVFCDYFKKFKGIKLHPIQFDELVTKVFYKSLLMNRTPKYIIGPPKELGRETTVISLGLQGLSNKQIFDDWSQEVFAQCLTRLWQPWGFTFEDIFKKPDLVLSSLHNEDGSVRVLNADGIRVK